LRSHEGMQTTLYFALSIGLCLALWELAVRLLHVPLYLVPPPSLVLVRLFQQWHMLLPHTLKTANETLIGFAAAVGIGLPLAVIITFSRLAERLIYPVLVASQVVPKVAIAPLFVIWFGFGFIPKMIVAFLISFFPIVIDTVVGLRSVDPDMIYLARSMNGNGLKTFLKIRLPNAMPNILAGMKVGMTFAVVGAVVGEFVGSSDGLGYVLLVATGNVDTPLVFASILLMTLLGVVLFGILEGLERLLIPWRPSDRLEEAGRNTI